MAKLMGIDYGTKRVGVAVTDISGSVAFPKATLPNDKALMRDIVQMIKDESISDIVVGESKDKDGADNSIARTVRKFAEDLTRETGVAVHFEPEYYSTQEARTHSGTYLVDAQAAAIILNSYITKRS